MRRSWTVLVTMCLAAVLTACTSGGGSTAAPAASPAPSSVQPSAAQLSPSTSVASGVRDLERLVRPTGEGIDLPDGYALFGKTYAETAAALQASLGRATKDSGVVSNESEYGTCPGTKLRALEFGAGALRVLFGDVERPGGPLTLFQWALTDKGDASVVPRATAFISKEDRLLVGIGTTVEELSASVPKAQLELIEAEGSFRPAFALSDGTTYGLFGSLSSTRPSGTVVFVLGGMDCRE